MKKIVSAGILVALILTACNNIPGQQLYTCADSYGANQQGPSADVPPPPGSTLQDHCQIPKLDKQEHEKAAAQQETPKQIPTSKIAIGHVYPLSSTVAVCDSTPPVCKNSDKEKIATDECHFDSMPIKTGMSLTEKLNRTR